MTTVQTKISDQNVSCDDESVRWAWDRYKAGGQAEFRDVLIHHYMPLVRKIANKLTKRFPGCVEVDDMISAGTFGLMEAIDSFVPGSGTRFATFCFHRVRGAILDEVRAMDWVPRYTRRQLRRVDEARTKLTQAMKRPPSETEVADHLKLSRKQMTRLRADGNGPRLVSMHADKDSGAEPSGVGEIADPRSVNTGPSAVDRDDLKAHLTRTLSRAEQLIVTLYYYEGLTLREIGAVLDISESRTCQMLSAVLARLRAKLKRDDLAD